MSLLIGLGLCLCLSAFFSAAEMAFLSTDRVRLRDDAERGNPRAKKILELFVDTREFLTTLLIGNNLVNAVATALFTAYVGGMFKIQSEWLVTALFAPILIIFCETVPKGFGRHRARGFLLDHEKLILLIHQILYWPSRILLFASELCLGGRRGRVPRKNIFVNEDEFRILIEESVRHGVLEEHDKKFVERILDFERTPIERSFLPLSSIPTVELSAKVRDAKEKARSGNSKIVLVYEEVPNLIIGMLYVFDFLFEEDEEKGLKEYLRPPIFLAKETSLEKAFLTLQEKRQSFALVTDARREVIGAVDIESLLAL